MTHAACHCKCARSEAISVAHGPCTAPGLSPPCANNQRTINRAENKRAVHAVHAVIGQALKLVTLEPKNPETLEPENPETLEPENPETLEPKTLKP